MNFTAQLGRLFVERPGSEARLLFALNVDFFSVEGNSLRGATESADIIAMTCLNIPGNLRVDPANIYLGGIIPGPHEPDHNQVGHYLRPLMDDLVEAFDKGVKYNRTARHPTGRPVRSAVAAAVMDFPAARSTNGLSSVSSHHYCSVCQCWHQSTYGATDFEHWKNRDDAHTRKVATEWLNAPSTDAREQLFKTYGVRSSEFYRLSYWCPSRQIVVDGMHCIFERICQVYARRALGLEQVDPKKKKPGKPRKVAAFYYEFEVPPRATHMGRPKRLDTIHNNNNLDEDDDVDPDFNMEDLDMDADPEVRYNGAPRYIRDLPIGEAGRLRSQKLQDIGKALNIGEVRSIGIIQNDLMKAIPDGRDALSALETKLKKERKNALAFVAFDIGVEPKTQVRRFAIEDYVTALIAWVIANTVHAGSFVDEDFSEPQCQDSHRHR